MTLIHFFTLKRGKKECEKKRREEKQKSPPSVLPVSDQLETSIHPFSSSSLATIPLSPTTYIGQEGQHFMPAMHMPLRHRAWDWIFTRLPLPLSASSRVSKHHHTYTTMYSVRGICIVFFLFLACRTIGAVQRERQRGTWKCQKPRMQEQRRKTRGRVEKRQDNSVR